MFSKCLKPSAHDQSQLDVTGNDRRKNILGETNKITLKII